jgi:flavin reductase (DIM6/NTAB) family NADH-FMN oxidoreductase RutF
MKIFPAQLNRRDSHELLMSAILPRPIAFVSTVGQDGVFNLAPFSCFAPLGSKPAVIGLGISLKRDGRTKDTLTNIEFTREFVVNAVDEPLARAMNQSAAEYPSEVDEFKEVGLTPVASELVRSPRLAESPINLECRATEILKYGETPTGGHIIIAEIILAHIRDDLWAGDEIDLSKWKPIGRLGNKLYCRISDVFAMERPGTQTR